VQLLCLRTALAAEGKFLVELNSIEPVESRCRLNFVIENKSDAAPKLARNGVTFHEPSID
jgi:hypothetical protein